MLFRLSPDSQTNGNDIKRYVRGGGRRIASHRLVAFAPLMRSEMWYGGGMFIRWMTEGCGDW